MINIQEKQRNLDAKRKELETRIESIKSAPDNERVAFRTEELPRRQSEIKSLYDDLQGDAEMIRIQNENRASMKMDNTPDRMGLFGGGGQQRQDLRSLGERFVEGDAYKGRAGDTRVRPIEAAFATDIKSWQGGAIGDESSMKTTMTTTSGWAPFLTRGPRVVAIGQIQPVIADVIPQDTTNVPGGRYMEETTYDNQAGLVPEGTTKPEAALAFTERTFTMAKIAVNLPITDEQLADVPQVRGIIDNRLALMVRQKEDGYLLNNTAVNGFDGFLQKSNVQNVPQGADPFPTAVLKAMTLVEYDPGFATVTALIMNPLDWQGYVTYQTTTGAYLVGSPDTTAITTMWGMPIIRTNRMPQGTALLGDFRQFSEILRREELNIRVGWINADFTNNTQRILAEERLVLNIYKGTAFAKVTGVNFA